ncbi:MAG: hypothetical protein HY301_04200 [Verrucomicrobia bacterium]|nr:hypothetical protein [Verrucomicrobiota bacterium]
MALADGLGGEDVTVAHDFVLLFGRHSIRHFDRRIDVSGWDDIKNEPQVNGRFEESFSRPPDSTDLRKPRPSGNLTAMKSGTRTKPPMLSHQWIDLVDLAAHRAMARKIRREPKLFDRARRNIARWVKGNRGCPPALREWKRILDQNARGTVLRIMTRPDEEGNRLRQSSPFCGILTEREREAIWARYDQE